jgi:putative aminopeptidase FrvX
MRKASLKFLQELCDAPGVPGFEREATLLTKGYIEKSCDEIKTDKLGSMAFIKRGARKAPVVFLPGHADEIGFLVSGIHSSGFLRFQPLGGWPDQVLLSQRVHVVTKKGVLAGVVASKPPHLMKEDERGKLLKKDRMYIDIGCCNKKEVEAMGVRVGDPIVPDSKFTTITKTVYKDGKKKGKATLAMGKAFDDRAGLFVAVEVLRRLAADGIKHPNTVVAAATTMEEVGLRGATTSGYMVNPDVCLAMDVGLAGDVPGIDRTVANTGLGTGVSITCYDGGLIPNQPLKELVIKTAEEEKIPHVLTVLAGGTTDGAAVSKLREGCPSIYFGIPTRHIHSHVGLLDLSDLDACVDLAVAVVKKLDAKTVASFTAM